MEQYETHKEMLNLPQYVFPICMLVFGYPTQQQQDQGYIHRFGEQFIVFENQYHRLGKEEFRKMFAERQRRLPTGKSMKGITTVGQATYLRKFSADFSMEMRRSVKEILKNWTNA
jgi:FMN reductase (NADPH)/FMN reductase [NAD(P)H]